MKKQKEEQSLKPIVLDSYKNTILTMVAIVLILTVLVPFIAFAVNRANKEIYLEGSAATEAYQSILEDYNPQKHQSVRIEYTNLSDAWHREQFYFSAGQLISRILFDDDNFEEDNFLEKNKVVYRRITEDDQQIVVDGGADLSQGFPHYLLTTTDCIKEVYLLAEGGLYQLQTAELDTTDAMGTNFLTLQNMLSSKTGDAEIESLSGEIDYNLFGLGHKYISASFSDKSGNTIMFKQEAIKLTLSGGEVYNFKFVS